MNHKYRPQLLEKISGVIIIGDKDESMKASLFKWLGMRRIYWINMNLDFNILTPSNIENKYVDQFKYIQHVAMRGTIRDDIAMFILSHSPCLQSIGISGFYLSDPQITDQTLQLIAEHFTGLQSLYLSRCREITDTGLITISEHCPNLQSMKVHLCDQITDASIILISTHCTELHLIDCANISDASIISISEKCTELKRLSVSYTSITDASLIAIAKNWTGLQYLRTYGCDGLSSRKLCKEFKSVSELQAVLLSIYPSLPI